MTDIRLTYFDFAGGRGEDCRLALHLAGVPFEDRRIQGPQWRELKPTTPYGGMPLLEIEGKGRVLAQSNAILVYLGRQHDLHPKDDWEAARHESLMAYVEELRGRVANTFPISDDAEKKAVREALATGYMQSWGANVERQLDDGPFIAGDTLNVADLKLFVLMNWFAKGIVDHIPTDVFKDFPKMNRVFEAVKSHPKVESWYAPASETDA